MSDRRVAALDGLRGVAVALVVLQHTVKMGVPDGPLQDALLVPFNGGVGVTLFFVLSGFLITGILVREKERTSRISIRDFYRRRLLRIVPALAVFLATVGVLGATGVVSIPGSDLTAAATFTSNYWFPHHTWTLGHTWSLSVEEQFYLIWPLLLIVLSVRRAVTLGAVYVLVVPVIRVASYELIPGSRDQIWSMFHTRADALLIGCILALLPMSHPELWARLQRRVDARWVVPVAAGVLLVSSGVEIALGGVWLFPVGYSLNALAGGALLLAALTSAPGTGWLRWRWLTFLGLISFSLYLWQQLFLVDEAGTDPLIGRMGDWRWALLSAAAAVVVAVLSQRFVERPFLRLKARTGQSRGDHDRTGRGRHHRVPGPGAPRRLQNNRR